MSRRVLKMKKTNLLFKVISLMLTLAMLCGSFAFMTASAAETVNLSVNTNGKIKVEIDGKEAHDGAANYAGNVDKGATVTLTAIVEEGDGIFMYWADKIGYELSKEATYTFTADSDTAVTAQFETAGKTTVVYRNNAGTRRVLSVSVPTEELTAHVVEKAYKYGCSFTGWDVSVAEINAEIKAGRGAVYVDPVFVVSEETFEINVVNGKIDGVASKTVQIFDDITLTPDNAATFKAWTDGEGNVISDKAELSIKAFKADTYTAITSANLDPAVTVYLTPAEDEVVHSRTLVFVPTGTEVVSYGLLYAKNTDYSTADMLLENVSGVLKQAEYTNPTGVLVNRFVDTEHVLVRAYLTYVDNGAKVTVYSDVVEAYALQDDYWVGADGNGDIFDTNGLVGDGVNDDTMNDGFASAIASTVLNCTVTDTYITASGATIKNYSNPTSDKINALRNAYIANGYELYNSAVMGNISSATYVRGAELAHLYWMGTSWIKVVTSASEGARLPDMPVQSGTVKVTQLTGTNGYKSYTSQYAEVKNAAAKAAGKEQSKWPFPDGTTFTSQPASTGNGMGYIIRLADGSFVIYDGGYFADVKEVSEVLTKLYAEYIKKDTSQVKSSDITIRAWFITHGHGDHTQAFLEYIYLKAAGNANYQATIERVVASPAKMVDTDDCYGINNSMLGVVNEARSHGIEVCYLHTGMVLKFGNVSIEALFTFEDLYMDKGDPFSWHPYYTGTCNLNPTCQGHKKFEDGGAHNETSFVTRVKVKNGKTLMMLADAGHAGADRMLEYYGTGTNGYLKSDYCQISHHACESFTAEAYDAIAGLISTDGNSKNSATIWFVPASYSRWENNRDSRNKTVIARLTNKIGATGSKIIHRNGTTTSTTATNSANTQSLGG